MRLQRLGFFILLIGVLLVMLAHSGAGSFGYRHERMAFGALAIAMGFGLAMLGTVVRAIAFILKPPQRFPFIPPSPPMPRRSLVTTVASAYAATTATSILCANCRKPQRAGARFCTRCGTAVASAPPTASSPTIRAPFPPIPVRPGVTRVTRSETRQANLPRPGKKPAVFRTLFFLGAILFGLYALAYWHDHGHAPWDDWNLPPDFSTSTQSIPATETAPPTAPDSAVLADSRLGYAMGPMSVETTAIDMNGYVGLRIQSHIVAPAANGLRFVVHFRYSDSTPVYSSESQYRDPAGQAAVAVPAFGGSTATAFIPISALNLRDEHLSLQVIGSLHDGQDQQIGPPMMAPVTFFHGSPYITRVRLETQGQVYWNMRNLKVTIHHPNPRYAVIGQIAVQFKDANGRLIPGQSPYVGMSGEAKLTTGFYVPAQSTAYNADYSVLVPPALIPAGAMAEIVLTDQMRGMPLSETVPFRMP